MPSLMGTEMQPWPGAHAPTVHALLRNEQSSGGPFMHVPPPHVPASVQASMSSHWAPSLPGFAPQDFATSSQTPTWQASGAAQALGFPPTHTPFTQWSASVQNSPSSHGPIWFTGAFTQTPFAHRPTLQVSLSGAQSPLPEHIPPLLDEL